MPTPAGYTEWGYLGAVVFLVVSFLSYLIYDGMSRSKQQKAMMEYFSKREQAAQDFFAALYQEGKDATSELTGAIKALLEKFQDHDALTREAIATMKERTQPNPTRKPPPGL